MAVTAKPLCHPTQALYAKGLCRNCYNRDRLARKVAERNAGRACQLCLAPFAPDVRTNRLFCGDRCRNRAKQIRSYGLTLDDYRELTASGRCFICQKKIKKWQIDHRHTDGMAFGVVCFSCNAFLLPGSNHDVEIARRLVEYLENPPATRVGSGLPKFALDWQNNYTKRKSASRRMNFA